MQFFREEDKEMLTYDSLASGPKKNVTSQKNSSYRKQKRKYGQAKKCAYAYVYYNLGLSAKTCKQKLLHILSTTGGIEGEL